MMQIGKKNGTRCIVRFGLSEVDIKKTWRQISVYPPVEAVEALKEFDLENDGFNNIVKVDESSDREYVNVKVRTKTKCKQNGENMKIEELARDDSCVIVVRPEQWNFEGTSGVALKALLVHVVDDCEFEIN